MVEELEMRAPVLKATLAWALALITDSASFLWHTLSWVHWDKLAQFAAFVYSVHLIWEFHEKRKAKKKEKEDGTE
jgi:hypothetical protein